MTRATLVEGVDKGVLTVGGLVRRLIFAAMVNDRNIVVQRLISEVDIPFQCLIRSKHIQPNDVWAVQMPHECEPVCCAVQSCVSIDVVPERFLLGPFGQATQNSARLFPPPFPCFLSRTYEALSEAYFLQEKDVIKVRVVRVSKHCLRPQLTRPVPDLTVNFQTNPFSDFAEVLVGQALTMTLPQVTVHGTNLYPRRNGVKIGPYCARILAADLPRRILVEFPRAMLVDLAAKFVGLVSGIGPTFSVTQACSIPFSITNVCAQRCCNQLSTQFQVLATVTVLPFRCGMCTC